MKIRSAIITMLLVFSWATSALSVSTESDLRIEWVNVRTNGYYTMKFSRELPGSDCTFKQSGVLLGPSGPIDLLVSLAQQATQTGQLATVSWDGCELFNSVEGGNTDQHTTARIVRIKLHAKPQPSTAGPLTKLGPHLITSITAQSERTTFMDIIKLEGVTSFSDCPASSGDNLVPFRIRKSGGDTNRMYSLATTAYATSRAVHVWVDLTDRTPQGECIAQIIQLSN